MGQSPSYTVMCKLGTVPCFVTAQSFCTSQDDLRNSGFLRTMASTQRYFSAIYDYVYYDNCVMVKLC